MKYIMVPTPQTYKSWVQLESDAMRIIATLNDYTYSIVVDDTEPHANNILFFDTALSID